MYNAFWYILYSSTLYGMGKTYVCTACAAQYADRFYGPTGVRVLITRSYVHVVCARTTFYVRSSRVTYNRTRVTRVPLSECPFGWVTKQYAAIIIITVITSTLLIDRRVDVPLPLPQRLRWRDRTVIITVAIISIIWKRNRPTGRDGAEASGPNAQSACIRLTTISLLPWKRICAPAEYARWENCRDGPATVRYAFRLSCGGGLPRALFCRVGNRITIRLWSSIRESIYYRSLRYCVDHSISTTNRSIVK